MQPPTDFDLALDRRQAGLVRHLEPAKAQKGAVGSPLHRPEAKTVRVGAGLDTADIRIDLRVVEDAAEAGHHFGAVAERLERRAILRAPIA